MASSNRHWPSLFKSKPSCATSHHQWQRDMNNSSLLHGHDYNPYSALGTEEYTPEPKPRWNPKPEQIRIMEDIFKSGMMNPPRNEIRRIRTQLQVYGQVSDANVFYWFQNRKSRSKQKHRQLKPAGDGRFATQTPVSLSSAAATTAVVPSSAITSTSTSGSDMLFAPPISLPDLFDISAPSIAPSVSLQTFNAPLLIPELSLEASLLITPPTYLLASGDLAVSPVLDDLYMHGVREEEVVGFNTLGVFGLLDSVADSASSSPPATATTIAINVSHSPVSEIQVNRSTVFINEVAYEVMVGPLNIKEGFGAEAVLIHSSGHPVLTDEWGLTLYPLQHGASYYLVQLDCAWKE